MNYNQDHIKNLIFEKISSAIRPEDEVYLDELIRSSEPVKELWEEVNTFYVKGKGAQLLSSLKEEENWQELRQKLPPPPRKNYAKKIILPLTAAAACLAGLFFFLPDTVKQKTTLPTVAATTDPSTSQQIRVQIGEDSSFFLSKSASTLLAADGTLQTDDKLIAVESPEIQLVTLDIPPGKDYKIILPDNSSIWINSATTVKFPTQFTGNLREITLNGEAYLKVAANPSQPFFVRTPSGTVQVLGTEFNLNTYDKGILKLALVEGKVALKASIDSANILPGQMGIIENGDISINKSFDKETILSWMDGIYYFQNASLAEIARILERCYPINVDLAGNELTRMHFTGAIEKHKPVESFLDDLVKSDEVTYEITNGKLRFFLPQPAALK